MHLKVSSPDKAIFTGKVNKVTVPTEAGEITLLPHHQPLSSVVKPGLLRIFSDEDNIGDEYVINEGVISIAVSKGILFVDGEHIIIITSAATTSPAESAEVLETMKKDMEAQLEKIKVDGNIEDIEKAIINVQKITADVRLARLKHVMN